MIDTRMIPILTRLRQVREDKHLSQADVAVRLGISQNSYKEIEKGSTHLKVQTLLDLSDILQTPVADLLGIASKLSEQDEKVLLALDAQQVYAMLQEILQKLK